MRVNRPWLGLVVLMLPTLPVAMDMPRQHLHRGSHRLGSVPDHPARTSPLS
jgi:hypothetical protein